VNTAGAWYAQSGSKFRELYTIMHLPYTSMVLSYILIGASLSPSLYPTRVILTLLAYLLGLGISAHALNEMHARHWGRELTKTELQVLFAAPMAGALLIGAYGMSVLFESSGTLLASFVLLACMAIETFFVFAYNTDFSEGRFHSDLAFAFSWGALPTIVSYYVNALTITPSVILVSTAMAATAGIEINLSRWCKDFRRRTPLSMMQFADDTELKMKTGELIAKPERALKLIVIVVDLAAIGLILHRWFT
jgi:hypothetical protein